MSLEKEVEKYRNENHMDYIKAIEVLSESKGNAEIFKTIYKITRLHIPQIVYKYISLDDNDELNKLKFNTLSEKKIFFAGTKYQNDPFEAKAFFYRPEELLEIERLKNCEGRIIDDFESYVIISCFTGLGINCMPMWAHYANNHFGFCVSYNTVHKDNKLLKDTMMRIQYVKERVDITRIIKNNMLDLDALINEEIRKGKKVILSDNLLLPLIIPFISCLKHDSWSYEQEYRCIIASNAPGAPFIDARPEAIYVGRRCKEVNKKILFDAADLIDVPIYDMEFQAYSNNYEYIPSLITDKSLIF